MSSTFIHLTHNKGFKWNTCGDFWIKGNINKAPNNVSLSGAFDFLQQNSFGFVWIHESEEKITICTDINRSIPLFYYWDKKTFFVSDNVGYITERYNSVLDQNQLNFFEKFGFTAGDKTLYQDIYSVLGGNIVEYNKKLNQINVQNYIPIQKTNNSLSILEEISNKIWQNVIQNLEGKTAIIPLSAGWDSRFILAALVKNNFKKIICFTYGKKDSYEKIVAEKICKQLNIEWHFVEYSSQLLQIYTTQLGIDYEKYGSNYNSIAYEQDFFAIQHLVSQNKIPSNAVFIPGYCGDFYAGSKWVNNLTNINAVCKWIVKKNAFDNKIDDQTHKLITNNLRVVNEEKYGTTYLNWYANHKSDKFINNGLRAFEFFEFQWIFPFMDYSYYNFWQNCNHKQLQNKSLYHTFLTEFYFKPLQINFNLKNTEELIYEKKSVRFIKKIIPQGTLNLFKKVLFKKQGFVNNQHILAEFFWKDLMIKNRPLTNNENQMHCYWYRDKFIKH